MMEELEFQKYVKEQEYLKFVEEQEILKFQAEQEHRKMIEENMKKAILENEKNSENRYDYDGGKISNEDELSEDESTQAQETVQRKIIYSSRSSSESSE
jgi:hypothetical protein